MEHRRVCFCMLSLLPLVQISKLSQANSLLFGKVCCRTPRGVRGLKSHRERGNPRRKGRTPRGVRGLKSDRPELLPGGVPSHPSRGAWIEIMITGKRCAPSWGRTPRGVRGLKSPPPPTERALSLSHPSRGAWIEIPPWVHPRLVSRSHPSRGAWIEITMCPSDCGRS